MLSAATTARMLTASSGGQRCQPAAETRLRWVGSSTAAAAPFRPTAPMSEPPNQLASATSRTAWLTVVGLSAMAVPPVLGKGPWVHGEDPLETVPVTPTGGEVSGGGA